MIKIKLITVRVSFKNVSFQQKLRHLNEPKSILYREEESLYVRALLKVSTLSKGSTECFKPKLRKKHFVLIRRKLHTKDFLITSEVGYKKDQFNHILLKKSLE